MEIQERDIGPTPPDFGKFKSLLFSVCLSVCLFFFLAISGPLGHNPLRFNIILSSTIFEVATSAYLTFSPTLKLFFLQNFQGVVFRSVASLSDWILYGQDRFSSHCNHFFLYFIKFSSFLSSFWPSRWATCPSEKALAMLLVYEDHCTVLACRQGQSLMEKRGWSFLFFWWGLQLFQLKYHELLSMH